MKSGSDRSFGVLEGPPAQTAPRGARSFRVVDDQPLRACFGVACAAHARCARYAAVDDAPADPETMVTCQRGADFPLFVPVVEEIPVTKASSTALPVGQRRR